MRAWKSAPFPYDVKVGIAYDLNLENNNYRSHLADSAKGRCLLENFVAH